VSKRITQRHTLTLEIMPRKCVSQDTASADVPVMKVYVCAAVVSTCHATPRIMIRTEAMAEIPLRSYSLHIRFLSGRPAPPRPPPV
jgi:hypothetical protein